jgi:hypothetical protein
VTFHTDTEAITNLMGSNTTRVAGSRESHRVEQVVIAAWQLDLMMKSGITCNGAELVRRVRLRYDAISIDEVE